MEIDGLVRADIGVHTELHGGTPITYGLQADVLHWLASQCHSEMATLETGCGLSTAVFANSGASHICISPFPSEFERVSSWCDDNGIPTDRVTFLGERSDAALPALEARSIDLALIDGSHAFPQAFVDFYYIALRLNEGGIIVIDDLQLWTGLTLRNFLAKERGWQEVKSWSGKTAAFRMTAAFDPMQPFSQQPYVLNRSAYQGLQAYAKLLRQGNFRYAITRAKAALERRLRSP
jgi:predicted O-methyltransferase YrrM